MKKILLVPSFILFVTTINAQIIKVDKVPTAVLKSFQKIHPDSISTTWELEDNNYGVSFIENNQKKELQFTKTGTLVQQEVELKSINDLPIEVLESFKKQFPKHVFKKAEKAEKQSGKIVYEIISGLGEAQFEIVYDEKGAFIKKEKVEEEYTKETSKRKENKK